MKIRRPSLLKLLIVITILILIVLVSSGFLLSYLKNENRNDRPSPQHTQHGNDTSKDVREQNNQINNTNGPLSLTKTETSPPVLIKSLSISSSKGKISYISAINGAKASQKCIFTARNDTGQQYSKTTTSTLDSGCEGELSNQAFSTGSNWTVTLQYLTSTSNVASRKVIIIQ